MRPPQCVGDQSCEVKGNCPKKTPIGAIVGGVVGGVAFAILFVAFLVWWGKRRRHLAEERRFTQGMTETSQIGADAPEPTMNGQVNWIGPRGQSTATTEAPLIGPRGSTVSTGEGNGNGDGGGNELGPQRTLSMGSPQTPDDIHQPYQLPA